MNEPTSPICARLLDSSGNPGNWQFSLFMESEEKMSKGLRNMTKIERVEAIQRRIKNATRGLGYWGAIDALPKEAERISKEQNKYNREV